MSTSTGSRGRDIEIEPMARTADEGGTDQPKAIEPSASERAEESLAAAAELARMSAQDALTAGVFLLVVLVGVMSQLIGGRTPVLRLALLVPVAVCFAVSLALVIHCRLTLVRALAELRRRTGAPLYPFPPWTPYASAVPLTSAAFERELRQLVSAAGRCCAIAGQAEAWAATTGLLFVFWTLIGIPAH